MKKFLLLMLLGASASTFAHGPNYNGHSGKGYEWVVPAVVGGIIGYTINRPPQTIYVQTLPVVVRNGIPTYQVEYCTQWTEIYNSDGTVTRTRTCQK